MIFFYAKIDHAFLPRLGLASYLCCLLLHLFLNTKRHPSDVETSYIPIFWLILSAVYPVGMSKYCTCFTQMINYNSTNLVRILTKSILVIASGRSTSAPNFSSSRFSWIRVRVCDFFKCAKRRRREKNEEKIRKFAVHQSLLTDISETLCVIFLKFGI